MKLKNEKKKVMVIGLDGATFDLIKPWVKEGRLPNFEKIVNDGAHGILTSTIMPLTPAAWTSCLTGKNPGKHGLFDFVRREPNSYNMITVTSKTRDEKILWEILGEAGMKVGIINVPLTYPPEKVNGFMISGLGTPGHECRFTYPESLYSELIEKIGDYKVYTEEEAYEEEDKKVLLEKWNYMTKKRADATFYLMNKYDWDFFMVVFMSVDWAQHLFWRYMDKTHPLYDGGGARKYGDAILQSYRNFDLILGEVLERVDMDTTIVIVSDHGFGPLYCNVFLNNWLYNLGLLNYRKTPLSNIKRWAFDRKITVHGIYNLLSKLKIARFLNIFARSTKKKMLDAAFLSLSDVDWSKTKAYCPGIYGQIFINLRGREPQGIVEPGREYEELIEHITSELHKLKDPDSGEKIVDKIFRREEIYSGKNLDKAADLLFTTKNWAYRGMSKIGLRSSITGHVIPVISGEHNPDGIFIATGKNIKKGAALKSANIVDIAPTILYVMGLPVPNDMDGRVLTDAFEDSFLKENPVRYVEPKGEKEKVKEKIKDLKALGRIL